MCALESLSAWNCDVELGVVGGVEKGVVVGRTDPLEAS